MDGKEKKTEEWALGHSNIKALGEEEGPAKEIKKFICDLGGKAREHKS